MKKYSFLLFLLLLTSLIGCSRQTDKLEKAEQLMENHPDSALNILRNIKHDKLLRQSDKALYALLYTQAQNKNNIPFTSDSLINIATDYYDESKPERAGYAWFYKSLFLKEFGNQKQIVEAFLKAQEFAESSSNNKLKGSVYAEKAEFYTSQNLTDSAAIYNKKAAKCFHLVNDYYNEGIIYIRLGKFYTIQSQYKNAYYYLNKALNVDYQSHDSILHVTILSCIGYLQATQHHYDEAKITLQQIPTIANSVYNTNKLFTMADLFAKTHQTDSACFYLNKIPISERKRTFYYAIWMNLQASKGNYLSALNYAKQYIAANDSANKYKLTESFAGLEKKYNYQNLKFTNQDLTLRNKRYIITVLILLLGIVVSVTLFLLWRNEVRKKLIQNQQIALEQEQKLLLQETQNRELVELQLEKEKQLLEQQLLNNKLIETQLRVQKVLFLNMEQYKKHVYKPSKEVHPFVSPIDNPVFYQQLIVSMDLEYDNISQRLKAQYPDLSEKDILICCFVLAGFDSGMMASVLGIQLDSINKSRYRIRKRFDIETSEKMEDYIRNL